MNFVTIFESHFESALMLDSPRFTIGSQLMLKTAFNEKRQGVLLSADNLWSNMHR